MLNVVKKTFGGNVLDLVVPHRCRGCGELGRVVCECCKNYNIWERENICPKCGKTIGLEGCEECELGFRPMVCMGYRDELIGRLAEEYKFYGVRAIGEAIAEMVDGFLPKMEGEIYLVPLPTIRKHVRQRGLDHTLEIAKKLAKRRGWKLVRALERAEDTVQVGANAEKRRAQAKRAYRIAEGFVPCSEATYILLDDIFTTGSSMVEARKVLKKAGARNVGMIVLAKASRSGCYRRKSG